MIKEIIDNLIDESRERGEESSVLRIDFYSYKKLIKEVNEYSKTNFDGLSVYRGLVISEPSNNFINRIFIEIE